MTNIGNLPEYICVLSQKRKLRAAIADIYRIIALYELAHSPIHLTDEAQVNWEEHDPGFIELDAEAARLCEIADDMRIDTPLPSSVKRLQDEAKKRKTTFIGFMTRFDMLYDAVIAFGGNVNSASDLMAIMKEE